MTAYEYDALGERTATVDPNANRTEYAYDVLGRTVAVTDPLSGVTAYAYDARGNLASLTDPAGNVTSWAYDMLGQLTAETDPLDKTKTYAYDKASHLVETVDRLGRITDYAAAVRAILTDSRHRSAAAAFAAKHRDLDFDRELDAFLDEVSGVPEGASDGPGACRPDSARRHRLGGGGRGRRAGRNDPADLAAKVGERPAGLRRSPHPTGPPASAPVPT